ncbi:hypothetical protein K438DRAFT_1807225 [Mycena galopus ATCC 62051]|nr:hypothetical protein K438DRAFT_1807225 [Mycena galopus ATCC 62051]
MPLGEVPITSYFSRRLDQPRAPKRKRVQEEDVQVGQKEQAILPFSKARKTKKARTTQDTDRTLDAEPCPTRKKSARTAKGCALPTPTHVSHIASSSTRAPTPPFIDLTSPNPKRTRHAAKLGKSVSFASSAPLTIPNTLNSPTNNSTNLNSKPGLPSSSSHSDDITFLNPASSPLPDDRVPSSPSQFYFPRESTPRKSKSSGLDVVDSSPPPTTESVERDDDGLVVPSSQSQWLLPMDADTTTDPDHRHDDDSIVPSSQSQWLETTTKPVERDDDDFVVPSSQSQWLQQVEGDTTTDVVDRDDDFVVPSSQSQWLMPVGDPVANPDEDDFIVPSSQSQWLLPMGGAQTEPVPHDEGFVPSSQSQLLLPTNGADSKLAHDVSSDDDDETIPSSQGHLEIELMPRGVYKAPRRPSVAAQSSGKPPPSDLDIDVADMFDGPLPEPPARADKDDSATESDEEPVVPPRPSEPVQQSSPEQDYGSSSCTTQSLLDDGCIGTLSSSPGSLPSAVKDFYDMVGSSDGSYPSGFPDSLRGQWTCDTTQVE